MAPVRFLLFSALATLVVVTGVVLGTGAAGAVMGPAVEERLAEPGSCPVELHHEVRYDASLRTYALRAIRVSAPTCPPGTRVTVAMAGRTIGQTTLDASRVARVELARSLPAGGVKDLQVSAVS